MPGKDNGSKQLSPFSIDTVAIFSYIPPRSGWGSGDFLREGLSEPAGLMTGEEME
jgi:hypothetical protein